MSFKDNFKINVSSDSNDRFDDENYNQIENQREQQRSQIEPILNEMKTKIEEGKSKYSSKNNSYYLPNENNPNPMLINNNFNNNMNMNSSNNNMNLGMNMNSSNNNMNLGMNMNSSNNNMNLGMNMNSSNNNMNMGMNMNNSNNNMNMGMNMNMNNSNNNMSMGMNMNMNNSNNNMNMGMIMNNSNNNMNISNNNNLNMNNNNLIINKFNLDESQSQISNNMNMNNNSIHSNNMNMNNMNNFNNMNMNNNSIHSNNMGMNMNMNNSNNMMMNMNNSHNMGMNMNNSKNNMMMNMNNNNSIHSNNMMNMSNNNNMMMNMNMNMNMNNNNSIHSKNMMMNLENNNSIHSNNMMMNKNSIVSNNTGMNNNPIMNNQNIMDMNNSNISKMKDLNMNENNFNNNNLDNFNNLNLDQNNFNNNSNYSNNTNKILNDKSNLMNDNMLNNINNKENEMKSNSKLLQNLKVYDPPNPISSNNGLNKEKLPSSKKSSKIFDGNNSKHSKLFDEKNKPKNSKLIKDMNSSKNSKIINSSKNSKLIYDINTSKNSKIMNNSKNSKLINEMNSSKNSKIMNNSKNSKLLNPSKNSKLLNDINAKNSKVFPDYSKDILNNFNQEKQDTIRKTNIIEKHSEVYSSYYDYTPKEKEAYLDELLEDINYYGEITKKNIEEERNLNPNKFMSPEEALNLYSYNKNNKFFVLGLLGKSLESQGCLVVIEKDDPKNKEENKEINTTCQFLINNMYNFIKFIFHFDFGEEMNRELLENEDKRKFFNNKLKRKLKHKFNLNYPDIIMTNPRAGSYQISAIIKKSKFNNYSDDQLFQELKQDVEFNKIIKVEKGILLSGCKLNPYMLDSRGDNSDGGWGLNETRGNHDYFPPIGWNGYGLRVLDRFDKGDNRWIDYQNLEGEWAVAYHGVGSMLGRKTQLLNAVNNIALNNLQTGIRQGFKDSNDIYHFGQKVGEGVYVTPKPEVLEQYSGIFNHNGTNYMIGFMTRVKPEKIRCPQERQDFWVINGTDNEIRPYRILIKEVNF